MRRFFEGILFEFLYLVIRGPKALVQRKEESGFDDALRALNEYSDDEEWTTLMKGEYYWLLTAKDI